MFFSLFSPFHMNDYQLAWNYSYCKVLLPSPSIVLKFFPTDLVSLSAYKWGLSSLSLSASPYLLRSTADRILRQQWCRHLAIAVTFREENQWKCRFCWMPKLPCKLEDNSVNYTLGSLGNTFLYFSLINSIEWKFFVPTQVHLTILNNSYKHFFYSDFSWNLICFWD